jgi:hypothetical protein
MARCLSAQRPCLGMGASLGPVAVGDDNDVAWSGGLFKNPDIVHVTKQFLAPH